MPFIVILRLIRTSIRLRIFMPILIGSRLMDQRIRISACEFLEHPQLHPVVAVQLRALQEVEQRQYDGNDARRHQIRVQQPDVERRP